MNQIWAKIDIKKKLFFGPKGKKQASAKSRSPPQELEDGPRSVLHLLVIVKQEEQYSIFINESGWCKNH